MPEAVNTQETNTDPNDGIQKDLNAADPAAGKTDGTSSEPITETTVTETTSTEPNTEEKTVADKTKNTWVQRRIDALTAEKHQERREKEALKAQTETLLAELAEMRKAGVQPQQQTNTAPQDPNATNPAPQPVKPAQVEKTISEAEIEARALAKADEIARIRAFNKACNDTYSAGKEEFDDFDRTINTFNIFSDNKGVPTSILDIITEMPKGHAVLYNLGKDPDLIEKIVRMPPAKQALELARLEANVNKPASRAVSSAPAPVKPIDGSGRAEPDPEKMSMEDYVKWREKTARKR